MAIAATGAAIALGGLLLMDYLHPDASSDADLVTSVLSRAGATSTPSERPVDLTVPETVAARP